MDIFILIIALIVLVIASIFDLKTREVPDLLNYGLIVFAFLLRVFLSLLEHSFSPLINGFVGFIIFLALALLLFYTGQMGGGDSKLLMGIGLLVGIPLAPKIPFLANFLINSLFAGAIYAFIWSFVLGVKNHKKVHKKIKEYRREKTNLIIKTAIFAMVFFSILMFFQKNVLLTFMVVSVTAIAIIMFYLIIFLKAVQETCFIKRMKPEKITLGDWVYEDIKYKGKLIISKKNLGVDEKQLRLLKKRGKSVLVKYGIPFVPSFLLGFVITVLGFNLLSLF